MTIAIINKDDTIKEVVSGTAETIEAYRNYIRMHNIQYAGCSVTEIKKPKTIWRKFYFSSSGNDLCADIAEV